MTQLSCKKYIIVRFQVEGVHRWKDRPHVDVSFLRDWHRHIFHFEVKISVTSSDREFEFIRVKRALITSAKALLSDPVELSCEAMAEWLVESSIKLFGEQEVEVGVYEDGENGGIVLCS